MDIQQFRDSLQLGLGRALLYARDCDVSEYRDVILDACLHCTPTTSKSKARARHSLGMGLEEFWKLHSDEKTEVRMRLSIYEKGPCSFCREGVVKRLIALDALTEQMRAECAYDANSDIRNLVR